MLPQLAIPLCISRLVGLAPLVPFLIRKLDFSLLFLHYSIFRVFRVVNAVFCSVPGVPFSFRSVPCFSKSRDGWLNFEYS